jgi:IS30 family transposase
VLRDVVVARRAWEWGVTFAEAARVSGLSHETVRRHIDDAGGMKCERVLDRQGHLSLEERETIRVGLVTGQSMRAIAAELGRVPSTVSREIKRNGGREAYRAVKAQRRADREAHRPKALWWQTNPQLWWLVQQCLGKWWSPDQISVRLKQVFAERPEMWVSPETIYKSIYVQGRGELRRELARCLRSGRARRVPHKPATQARTNGPIKDMVNISQRPAEVEDRALPGHWEGDLILGKDGKSAVATLVERKTRWVMLVKIDSKQAAHVAQRLSQAALRLPEQLRHTFTWDQGSEMADHATFALNTGIDVYFCDPHAPWQRGTNENTNGLLRQYMPKGTDLTQHSQDDLDAFAHSLNGRPRKTLGYMTPSEVLTNALH